MIDRYRFTSWSTSDGDVDVPESEVLEPDRHFGEWCRWDQVSDELARLRAQIETLTRERDGAMAEARMSWILESVTGVTRDGIDPRVARVRFPNQDAAETFIGLVYDTVLGKTGAA